MKIGEWIKEQVGANKSWVRNYEGKIKECEERLSEFKVAKKRYEDDIKELEGARRKLNGD